MNIKEIIAAVRKAMNDKPSVLAGSDYILVWDSEGYCIAYSCIATNYHVEIPTLQGYYTRYSLPVTI